MIAWEKGNKWDQLFRKISLVTTCILKYNCLDISNFDSMYMTVRVILLVSIRIYFWNVLLQILIQVHFIAAEVEFQAKDDYEDNRIKPLSFLMPSNAMVKLLRNLFHQQK